MHHMRSMMYFKKLSQVASRFLATTIGALVVLNYGTALGAELLPNTKVRLTIVQWMPTKGTYEQWAPVGGEFTVSREGTISVPLLGPISVGNMDESVLASAIAKRLKEKIGLVDEPAATVEILQYPSVYIVGDIANPGEYQYHSGITVLQALAMGGGELRALDKLQNSLDVTKLVGELKEIDDAIIRNSAKIERLEAETAGEQALPLRKEPSNDSPFAAAIYKQEEVIFSARTNELTRQSKSLTALRDLLSDEISILQEKIKSTDAGITSTQKQLDSTIALIDRGAIVATRQAEVERAMRGYQNDRLDLTAEIMRARQNISQATRDLEGLFDKRRTEVASELQSERATMSQLKLKRDTGQKLLMDRLSSGNAVPLNDKANLRYSIIRGGSSEIDASETTAMMPGDVLKVTQATSEPYVSKAFEATRHSVSQ